MHFTKRESTLTRAMHVALTGLLAMGLVAFAAGCGGAGANGGEDDGGDDDGGGDGTTAPAAPSGLTGESEYSAVSLSWEAVEAEDLGGYNVYRGTESGVSTSGDPLDEGRSETTYTDDGAENGTTYYYVVTAVDGEGNESDPSNEVEKTPFDEPPTRP